MVFLITVSWLFSTTTLILETEAIGEGTSEVLMINKMEDRKGISVA
jgi:hypothetical protein